MEALFSLKPSLVNICKTHKSPEYLNKGNIDDNTIVLKGANLCQ